MISIELARKLKEAGLRWVPGLGDMFVADYDNGLGPTLLKVVHSDDFGFADDALIFLPRLDQLLAEIEKRGYGWEIWTTSIGLYSAWIDYGNYVVHEIRGNETPEDAAARALLWILEKERVE